MSLTYRELQARARELGEELGETVQVVGVSASDLESVVASLEAKVAARGGSDAAASPPSPGTTPRVIGAAARDQRPTAPKPTPPPVDGASDGSDGGPPPPPKPKVVVKYAHQVAPGRSITTPRGILGPGEEVRAGRDCSRGSLDVLVKAGVVLRNPDGTAGDGSG